MGLPVRGRSPLLTWAGRMYPYIAFVFIYVLDVAVYQWLEPQPFRPANGRF